MLITIAKSNLEVKVNKKISPQVIHVSLTVKTSKVYQIFQSALIKSILETETEFNSS